MTVTGDGTDEWSLSDSERVDIVARAADGISSMCFFNEGKVSDAVAAAAAKSIESKAYSRAKVESKTTTGSRPRHEVQRAYFRILSQHLIECVQDGCASVSQATSTVSGQVFDVSGTGREFVTKEMAHDLLEPMLRKGSKISQMKLSTKSIGADSAPVFVDAIANVSSMLTHADVSDIIAGRPEAEVLSVLRDVSAALAKCGLAEVNLSDNALGEKGIRACTEIFTSQKQLKGLYLKNIGCSVNACKAVDELVASGALETLHLYNNMSDDEGAKSVASLLGRCPNMKDFQMAASRVGLAGGVALVAALATGTSLLSLDLTGNPMEPSIAPPVASLLPRHPHLVSLVLSDLNLTDEGVAPLATALAAPDAAPELRTLDLSQNEITRKTTPALARALHARRATLRRVNLSDNELECAGAIHVATGLRGAAALEALELRCNQIGRVGAREVARCCCAGGKAALRSVELDDNLISADGVAEITAMFKKAFPGKRVLGSLDENDEEGDPNDEDVLDEAHADVEGMAGGDEDVDLDLGKLTV